MKKFYLSAALLALLSLAGRTEAGTTYDFSFSGGGVSGSGTFETAIIGGGVFATSSTGSVSGDPNLSDLSNLVPNTNAPNSTPIADFGGTTTYSYDNQLYIGSSLLLDGNGLLWSSGSVLGNLYYWSGGGGANPGYYFLDSVENLADPGNVYGTAVSFSLTPVPEPSTLLSGGTAVLVGLAFAWRRRKGPAA